MEPLELYQSAVPGANPDSRELALRNDASLTLLLFGLPTFLDFADVRSIISGMSLEL